MNRCPYLNRTPKTTLRKLSTIRVSNVPGLNPAVTPTALLGIAQHCPVIKPAMKTISTSSKCPYASVVDAISDIGTAGKVSQFIERKVNFAGESHINSELNLNSANGESNGVFDYESFFDQELDKKKQDRSYRYFNNINRLAPKFPQALTGTGEEVTVWCSNDYLGMSKNSKVIESMKKALDNFGAGAGGTRNIAGNAQLHLTLERELAELHKKPAALVFSSCFVANDATLSTLAGKLPGCVIFSILRFNRR